MALERQEFHLVFQPLLDLASDRITGCEALLRWRHPSLGLVPPSDFIPIAEETGLIGAIGKWAVREACRVAATWPGDLAVSVNFSAIQLREVDVLPTIVNALADARLAPARLEVEITESVVISESGFALALLRALRHLGVRIALDDFGTGYSSLSYLRKLPLDSVKIDHSFVRDMIADPACASIVKSVIALARDLGISVTAEGVETAEQLSQLRAMGCAKAQGYLISEPKAAAAIASLLREHNGSLGLERTA